MKLKNILILASLILTMVPAVFVSLLFYNSGYNLSKESYTHNLVESINVQADYISQTVENNMIADYRFISRNYRTFSEANLAVTDPKKDLLMSFQQYLEASEDRVSVCILLDKNGSSIYTIGEKAVIDAVEKQVSELLKLDNQKIVEFNLSEDVYSLGIVTPVWDGNHVYQGSMVSIFDESYLFKIISSYYEIADTTTYVCRSGGDIINFRGAADKASVAASNQLLNEMKFESEGIIDTHVGNVPTTGYYKNIHNSPWYLVSFIDHQQIYAFTNQFILVYLLSIAAVVAVAISLSVYFSRKVVEPIHDLITVMEGYQNDMDSTALERSKKKGYFETEYLWTRFREMMNKILLVQHNFQGIYQLYQSSTMDDTNIDIDVKQQTVHSNKEAFQDLMDHLEVPEGSCIVDRFTRCFCDKDQVQLARILEIMRDEHLAVTTETEVFTPYMNQKWFHVVVAPMYEDERLCRLFVQLRDISSFKKQEIESSEQARRDSLTGLYNRSGFIEKTTWYLREENRLAFHVLMFIDMNYFKMVNDNLGHSAGDELLRTIGKDLLALVGSENIVSRFGGDEFAIFMPVTTQEAVEELKNQISSRLVYPFSTEKINFTVSASIGTSIWNMDSCNTLEKLLEQADTAMYQSKREMKAKDNIS